MKITSKAFVAGCVFLTIAFGLIYQSCHRFPQEHSALSALPRDMLWAWERPEDLRWLPENVGVAYVAVAIKIIGDEVEVRPRLHPLKLTEKTIPVPVIHVDASYDVPPSLNLQQRDTIVNQVLVSTSHSNSKVIQLDFEVRRSQRDFLFDVVKNIREKLPADRALSVTALASWCAGDYWLEKLPADEIVPMVFRMARDTDVIRKLLSEASNFPHQKCQTAVGFSTDEATLTLTSKRHYYFSPKAWTEASWHKLQSELNKTQSNSL